MLNILNGRIRLDVGIQFKVNAIGLEQVSYLGSNAELDQIRVRSDERLLESLALDDARYLIDCPVAMIGNAIQHKTINSHIVLPPVFSVCF